MSRSLIASDGPNSPLAKIVGKDVALASITICALAILLAQVRPCLSIGLYVVVALIGFVPDR